jgi:hypothetical protein
VERGFRGEVEVERRIALGHTLIFLASLSFRRQRLHTPHPRRPHTMPPPVLPYKRPFFMICLQPHEIEVRATRRPAFWCFLELRPTPREKKNATPGKGSSTAWARPPLRRRAQTGAWSLDGGRMRGPGDARGRGLGGKYKAKSKSAPRLAAHDRRPLTPSTSHPPLKNLSL